MIAIWMILFLLRCAKHAAGDLRSSKWYRMPMVNSASGQRTFFRFCPWWHDEYISSDGTHYHRPPWWRPFNVLLHCWQNSDNEWMHDHPRWSATICLRGEITEQTPWTKRVLRPGSIVLRTHRAIHRFEVTPRHRGRTWTLFIVGRRRIGFRQSVFRVHQQRGTTTNHEKIDEVK